MTHRCRIGCRPRWGALFAAAALIASMVPALAVAAEDLPDPSLLISTDHVSRLLQYPKVRIVDVRDEKEFQKGHIPNAVSLPARKVVDPASRIRGARLPDARLAHMFGRLGIGKETHVVLYDDRGGHLAARILWILHYLGHRKASVVDGGFPKWQKEGRPVTEQTERVKRQYFPIDLMPHRQATADWILDHLNNPDIAIIDVRPSKMYAKGHIPRAISIPWKKNLHSDKTWKRPDELRKLFESSGVTKDKNVVVYCQFGNMNAHTYLTLKALGYPRVRSYDRAWAEWGNDPSLPKVTEAALGLGGKQSITMQISFECVKFEGDCDKIQVIKPPKDQQQLHRMESGISAEDALKGSQIKDGVVRLAPGEMVFVKTAYVNDSNRTVRFRAIPHHIEPQNLQIVAIFQCMCLGETYTVPPHSGWYRILRVGAAFDMPAGSRFVATHILTSENLLPEPYAPRPHVHTHHHHQ